MTHGADDDVRRYTKVSEMPADSPIDRDAVTLGVTMLLEFGEDEISKLGPVFRRAYEDFVRDRENHSHGLGRPPAKRP